jgi:hypothetical protein
VKVEKVGKEDTEEEGINAEMGGKDVDFTGEWICESGDDSESESGEGKGDEYFGDLVEGALGVCFFGEEPDDDKEEDVEVFFDSEGPCVVPDALAVVLDKECFGDEFVPFNVISKCDDKYGSDDEHHPKRRVYFEAPTEKKVFAGDVAEDSVFVEKKAGNEEATQHKKDVHADPAAAYPEDADVVPECAGFLRAWNHVPPKHEDEGESPQDVDSLNPFGWSASIGFFL